MELRGVGHRYGLRGAWVLRGVDIALPARALVRVEGANGAGKSTLLRLLAGIDTPAEGRITGRRTRTAYVPERFSAALPLTATGYLVHLGRIHGLRTAEAKRRAGEWLTRFGAAEHARTPLAELSKGTSQKVAVAQALLAAPDLLVLDEAWTGLDAAARAELDRAVAERVAAGATVVFVDHDPRRLAGAADLTLRAGDGGVGTVTAPVATGTAPGPRVLVVAVGPRGASLPTSLPGDPDREREAGAPGSGADSVRLTVAASHSDALLKTLLTARPPWHIRQVAAMGPPEPSRTVRPGGSAEGPASPGPGGSVRATGFAQPIERPATP
ncbi:ATP-binding cassette domain-containing protein [Streptomyces californicus]|uniref:ABC transporter ATP-binding protein n=1 Tax=Streptomyces californicus TaxID=67351 RepID=UPI00296F277B|nr:ATP-binding cassette domain-containing protein [Streptomyces californicus]MDW4899866.1 ATP-binding cassette domain-containing protein [Streptomyces californicus]